MESGSIQSDNHPNNYPINQVFKQPSTSKPLSNQPGVALWKSDFDTYLIVQDKTYEISVSAGKKIKITFEEFSLEHNWRCGWDYLMVC